jgi:hypothetical protein
MAPQVSSIGALAAALFVLILCVDAKAQSEREMQERLCADMERNAVVGVIEEGTNARRSRVDCMNQEFAIEIDFSKKWAEAFGQAAFYASQTNKKAGVILLCQNEQACLRHGLRLESILAYLKIPTMVWWCPLTAASRDDCVQRPQFGSPQ